MDHKSFKMQLSLSFIAETKKGETKVKKKIIAGMTVTIFLVAMITFGIPVRAQQFVGTFKIGVMGPRGRIQWDGLWEGAQLARDLVNDAGGLVGPDGRYEIVLVDIDEPWGPYPSPPVVIAELQAKLEANPDMQIIIGGSSSEYIFPMREFAMDYAAVNKRPIWIIAGAAADELIDCGNGACGACVRCDYDRYKYMFRVFPTNLTTLSKVLILGFIKQIVAPKLAALYYGDLTKLVPAFVIAENLRWCDPIVQGLCVWDIPSLGIDVKGVRRPGPYQTNFTSELDAAEAAGAKLVIHIFSAVAGAAFIKQWGLEKRKFACVGINVESMPFHVFWEETGGLCEYETTLAPLGTGTNINPDAKPLSTAAFWDEYKATYGHHPIYTAWGAYDAIIGLSETSFDPPDSGKPSAGKGWMVHWQAGDIDKMIEHIETLGVSDGFAWKRVEEPLGSGIYYRSGILGFFRYTGPNGKYHDVFCAPDALAPVWSTKTVRPLLVQWQAGRKNPVFPQDQDFSRKWIIPPWMYSLETDFAGGPLVPTAIPPFNYTTPDRTVGLMDLLAVGSVWFQKPPFFLLEADMQPQDHFIDIYDAARIGKDWLQTATPQ